MDQPPASLPALLSQRAETHGTKTILRTKHRGIWKSITWADLGKQVRNICSALQAAGIGRGDVVATLSETTPEAVYADLAIQSCGAASLAIDPECDPDRLRHQLATSNSRLVFAENEEQLDKILLVRDECHALSRIIVFDTKGLRDFADASCTGLEQFAAPAEAIDWPALIRVIEPAQPAIQWFTQNNENRSLTHRDLAGSLESARAQFHLQPNDERLAVLRLADPTERAWGLYPALDAGCISNYPERPDTVVEDLREVQPTVLVGDAVVWDHLCKLATARAEDATALQSRAYRWGLKAGRAGGAFARLADFLVLRAVKQEFGLRNLRLAYVGGASVAPAASDWAGGLGINIRHVDAAVPDSTLLDPHRRPAIQDVPA